MRYAVLLASHQVMLSLVQVQKAIRTTAKCGAAYLNAKEPHKGAKLPKRKHYTAKLPPKLDSKLNSGRETLSARVVTSMASLFYQMGVKTRAQGFTFVLEHTQNG